MTHQKLKKPGENEPLFPGKKEPTRLGRLRLDDLKRKAQELATTLGPIHPEVRILRKEISDRDGDKIRR